MEVCTSLCCVCSSLLFNRGTKGGNVREVECCQSLEINGAESLCCWCCCLLLECCGVTSLYSPGLGTWHRHGGQPRHPGSWNYLELQTTNRFSQSRRRPLLLLLTQVPKTSVNLDGDVREKFMCPPSILTGESGMVGLANIHRQNIAQWANFQVNRFFI